MTSERIRKMMQAAEDATADMVKQWEETGELRHLHGRPLNLEGDPEWLGVKVVKDQGYSHPLLERARELDEPQQAAERVLERLRRRRTWLSNPNSHATPVQIHTFNEARRRALDEYALKLQALNRAILHFNLAIPLALHRPLIPIDSQIARVSEEIAALDWSPDPTPVPRRRRRWRLGVRGKQRS